MPTVRLPAGMETPLTEAFADMPKSVKGFISAGLRAVASVDQAKQQQIATYAISRINTLSELEMDEFAAELNLNPDEAGEIVSALSLLLAIISSRKDEVEEITGALADAGLIPPSGGESLKHFLGLLVSSRREITRIVNLDRLADQVLPSFQGFHTSVDLRIGFRQQKVDATVPIVLVYLHTDSEHQRIFFQMQKGDVQKLIRELERVLAKIEDVERWASSKSEKGSL